MKSIKWPAVILAVLTLTAAGSALADRPRHHRHGGSSVHFGVVIGPSAYWGPWRYPPYYHYPPYYPSTIVIERAVAPPVYIQQPPPPVTVQAAPPIEYWYYCDDAKAYYPYVKECPAGWRRVLPTPPSP